MKRLEIVVLLLIVLICAGMRLYRINDYMTFLGDEGRDAIIVKKILTQGDLPLLGPPTSVGNMYLGPLYYYMMVAAMTVGWLNPVAAAVMVALIGTATVGLIYYLSREWFGRAAAVVASLLYALSPVNIIYSRSSWNPNPAPFFTLLAVLGLDRWHHSRDGRWFILTGVGLAFAVQMHYLGLILTPVFGLLWLYQLHLKFRRGVDQPYFWLGTLGAVVAFLILMSPLAIFDFRHNFMNYRAVTTFFLGDRATTVNLNIFNTLGRMLPIYQSNLISRYMAGQADVLSWIVAILVALPLAWVVVAKFRFHRAIGWPYLVLGLWLAVGIAGLSLYKQTIYDHYLGFLNPVPYFLLGSVTTFIPNLRGKLVKMAYAGLAVLVGVMVIVALQKSPLLNPPNRQLSRTQDVARYLIGLSGDKPFNFALIAEHNYDAAYQFYLDMDGHKPEQLPFVITDQLLVVCEDAVCQPVGHPKYEIAAFGWSKIDSEQTFEGVKVFKLTHNMSGEQPNVQR